MTKTGLDREAKTTRIHRRDGWTPDRMRTFLYVIRDGASVRAAAKAAGMSRQGAYRFRRSAGGEAFAYAWDKARQIAEQRRCERGMEAAIDRALQRFRRFVGPRYTVHLTLADPVKRRPVRPPRSTGSAAPAAGAVEASQS